jgi:hypothetical protein
VATTQEFKLENQTYSWSDKYRPRKPRYYNRVHTGYDWNQYNKKHYDIDNPPPKTVQGYKLNIFYPDMIDKTKTPHYSIVSHPTVIWFLQKKTCFHCYSYFCLYCDL